MPAMQGKWAGRFIWAAVIQGLIIVIVTILIVEPQSFLNISSYYSPSKIIAAGGAGTWLFTGYISYLVAVVAIAVTANFYSYYEGSLGKVYHGATNYLAWGHYIFMNIGVAGSMLLMIWGGYIGGWAGAAVSAGGLGYNDEQIHIHYLSVLVNPIGAFITLACLGALLGGLGFVVRSRMK